MYFVTFSPHAAKKDIVSFAKLKSINPVIINLDTIPKFPNSRESPIYYGRELSGCSKMI